MKERPIIFSGPMVRAILDGRKTQTRRVVKPQPTYATWTEIYSHVGHAGGVPERCPHGVPGDRLWVREAFRLTRSQDHKPPSQDWWKSSAWYEADRIEEPSGCGGGMGKLRPSIYMPKWASRVMLEVVDVRVERLQEITEKDAESEGVTPFPHDPEGDCWTDGKNRTAFEYLWGEIHGYPGAKKNGRDWESNPWVWVISFREINQT